MATLTNIWGRIAALPMRLKVIGGVVLVGTLMVMWIILAAATATDWVALSSGVDPKDVGEMEAALQAAEIDYEKADQGTSINVKQADLGDARVALATANLLDSSGTHFTYEDLLEEQGGQPLGMTEAEFELQKQRLLEGLIAADIEQIDGVKGASVRLTMPEDALFADEQADTTAGVTIDTGGAGIEQSQVRGIQMLVASAVENMKPAAVTIVDDQGMPLGVGDDSGSFGLDEAVRKAEERFNSIQEQRLMTQLERIAGEGNVTTLLNTNMDLDDVKESIREYGGEENLQGPIASQALNTEDLETDGGTGNGGVVGTGTNLTATTGNGGLPQFPAAQPTAGPDSDYARVDTVTQYNNDSVEQAIDRFPGLVDNMTLSVVAHQDLPAETLAALDNVARTFLGKAQQPENNTYSMTTAPLPQTRNLEAEALTAARREAIIGYMKWLLLGLGVIFIAFFMRRQLADRTMELLESENQMLALDTGFDPIPLAELEASMAPATIGNAERLALQNRVQQITSDNPDEAALLVRSWLHDR